MLRANLIRMISDHSRVGPGIWHPNCEIPIRKSTSGALRASWQPGAAECDVLGWSLCKIYAEQLVFGEETPCSRGQYARVFKPNLGFLVGSGFPP